LSEQESGVGIQAAFFFSFRHTVSFSGVLVAPHPWNRRNNLTRGGFSEVPKKEKQREAEIGI